jgi:serine/threonine protein kinase
MTGLENREPQSEIYGYRILKKLGEGGTARVYSALAPGSSTPVALKVFRPDHGDPAELARRVSAEVNAYRALEHPNIVKVLALPREGAPALVLELVDGWTLSDFQSRLPYILPEISVRILIEALKAIEHAHAAGIIHRDLKPSNILISKTGQVLVTDFGLAKISGASLSTQTGTILGSPHYMSPEQARGDVIGPRSDLFSLTSVLYFLITGTPPFNGNSPLAVLATVIERRLEPARGRNPKVSWELSRILERGFAKNPSERFASATDFRESLEGYLAGLGLSPESFTFAAFLEDPHGETLRALNTIAEKIALKCEEMIRKGKRAESLELLSHLSLVAPNSQMIQQLTDVLDRKRSRKGLYAAVTAAMAVVLALLGVQIAKHPRTESIAETAPKAPKIQEEPKMIAPAPAAAEPVTAAPAAEPPKAEVAAATPAAVTKAAPKSERVVLDLPPGFSVMWDGKDVPVGKRNFRANIGSHKLVLKVGKNSFKQTVKVVAGEPTNIRVNPPGGKSE